jgi:hypothetical protein
MIWIFLEAPLEAALEGAAYEFPANAPGEDVTALLGTEWRMAIAELGALYASCAITTKEFLDRLLEQTLQSLSIAATYSAGWSTAEVDVALNGTYEAFGRAYSAAGETPPSNWRTAV